jgi:hypothetical protein
MLIGGKSSGIQNSGPGRATPSNTTALLVIGTSGCSVDPTLTLSVSLNSYSLIENEQLRND